MCWLGRLVDEQVSILLFIFLKLDPYRTVDVSRAVILPTDMFRDVDPFVT